MINAEEKKQKLLKEQKGKCLICGKRLSINQGHIHHAIYPKSHTNYKKFQEFLDQPENLVIVCWKCHNKHGDLSNAGMRNHLFEYKKSKGYDMDNWNKNSPMKIKDRFGWG